MKQRDNTIDFIKCMAALLITNSHIDVFEPLYRLGTGGAIGDALFFFCSGYTLFMGRMGRFDNWYKRRINRIFPPIIMWALLAALFFNVRQSFDVVLMEGGGWFVQCILIYYVLAYPIRKYASDYLKWVFFIFSLIAVLWFFLITKEDDFFLYGWNYCKWVVFFLVFLYGAYVGLHRENYNGSGVVTSLSGLAFCTLLWYSVTYFQRQYGWLHQIQIVSILPLIGVVHFLYQFLRSNVMTLIYNIKGVYQIIRGIGGLCFEIYLVQIVLLHTKLYVEFPYNIIMICVLILMWAYLLHICSNFFSQTFRETDYNWKQIFKIY